MTCLGQSNDKYSCITSPSITKMQLSKGKHNNITSHVLSLKFGTWHVELCVVCTARIFARIIPTVLRSKLCSPSLRGSLGMTCLEFHPVFADPVSRIW